MNWLFAGELLCAGAVEGFACCRARPADWIGGRARRLAAAIGGRARRLAASSNRRENHGGWPTAMGLNFKMSAACVSAWVA